MLVAGLLGIVSCSLEDDNEICDYNIQLSYHYNLENFTTANMLDNHVSVITEYIFDEDGILFRINTIHADECLQYIVSEQMLPPGRYSVIAWGNLGNACAASDAVIGVTRRDEMLLQFDNPCSEYPGYELNGDRIFHAYRTFTVGETGISRLRVDVVHSHLLLRYRVRWRTPSKAPELGSGEFQMRLNGNPSEYNFMPEYISREQYCRVHDRNADDDYRSQCNEVIHHIPTVYTDRNVRSNRVNHQVNVDRIIDGEFIAFRLRNSTPTTVTLHHYSNMRAGERQLMNTVPLGDFFRRYGEDLDKTLKQEYHLEFIINDDGSVSVQPIGIADWDEGGYVW